MPHYTPGSGDSPPGGVPGRDLLRQESCSGRRMDSRMSIEPRRRRKIRKIRDITFPALPTAFTLANGVCGLAAITVVTSHGSGLPQDRLGVLRRAADLLGHGL